MNHAFSIVVNTGNESQGCVKPDIPNDKSTDGTTSIGQILIYIRKGLQPDKWAIKGWFNTHKSKRHTRLSVPPVLKTARDSYGETIGSPLQSPETVALLPKFDVCTQAPA